jgi:hypothetical protein
MLTVNAQALKLIGVLICGLALQACGEQNNKAPAAEVKAAPKLTNDATTYAQAAWQLINQVDGLVYAKKVDVLETDVRQATRKLSTDWRINVKMTDAVTEGKYALCRKALTSLEIFARETIENSSAIAAKQADYERDKAQCKDAIEHPEYGNTDPKQKGNAIANMQ